MNCLVENCTNPHRARGYCKRHYSIWNYARKNNKPMIIRPKYFGCKISGCTNKHDSNGYCHKHYEGIHRAEKRREYDKKRYFLNKIEIRKKKTARDKFRRKNDTNFKIKFNLRSRFKLSLNGKRKSVSAIKDLGISIEEFKIYFSNKFYINKNTGEYMTWKNYGKWHIDHIKPLSSFNLLDKEEQKKAVHYTNLQPLWAEENIKKNRKY